MFDTVSRVTYVPGPAERSLRRWAFVIVLIAVFGLGWLTGAQPQSMATCQAHTSAETCSLAFR